MRKAERLFQLLTLLRSRRTVITAAELAERLDVSERTIYRDMQALSLSGVPIESEAGVGYRLTPGFSLPPLMFDESELHALITGMKMVRSWGDDAMASAAQNVLDKVQAILPERLHTPNMMDPEWLVMPTFNREVLSQYSTPIRQAILNKSKVDIDYIRQDGTASTRRICPLGMVYWDHAWTLIAWCEIRNDYRMFRFDRIQQLQITSDHFITSDTCNLQHYMAQQPC